MINEEKIDRKKEREIDNFASQTLKKRNRTRKVRR